MAEKDYGAISDPDQLDELARRIVDEAKPFGYDIETGYEGPDMEGFSLHPETGFVVGFSFTNSIMWARYVPVAHDLGPNCDEYRAAVALWTMLRTGLGVAHNAGFEQKMLRVWFLKWLSDHPIFGAEVVAANGYHVFRSDTMIESYVRAKTQVHGLKPLAKIVFNHDMRTIESLFPDMTKKQEKALRFNILELTGEVIAYACEDALWCLALHLEWYASVKDSFIYNLDMSVLREVLPEMGRTGLMYDWSMMRDGAEKAEIFREYMRQEISEDLSAMVGHPVNINLASPKQVSEVLFDKLGMKTTVYTANTRNLPKDQKKMSTGALALKGLSKQYPVVKRILQWKEVKRLGNAFLETYEKKFGYAPDGMTHPDLLQCAVISGRFAHSSPNYAQSPKKYFYQLRDGRTFSYNFRAGIRAPRDFYILGFDLSQAELRAIAGEAQEQGLLSAFASGVDVHCQTAALMLRVPVEQVISEHAAGDSSKRDIGKTLNFAIAYGMEARGLADRLNIPIDEAEELMRLYFEGFPAVKVWMERQVAYGRAHGYVLTKFGRKVPIWEYLDERRFIREKGDRLCINAPIQGGATGDYMRLAMVRAQRAINKAGMTDDIKMCMNIHDALEFYVRRTISPQKVIDILASVEYSPDPETSPLRHPAVLFPVDGWPAMKADWHMGLRWGEMVDILVDERGQAHIQKPKKAVEQETEPEAFDDDESADEIQLPAVDTAALKEVLGKAPEPQPEPVHELFAVEPEVLPPWEIPEQTDETGKQVIVKIAEMPDQESYIRFMNLLDSRPGLNVIVLSTPDGDLELGSAPTSLCPSNSAEISLILHGARVFYAVEDVDASTVLSGLQL